MIILDFTAGTAIYEQICNEICADIVKGVFKENDKLPGARTLAKELGLNPNTVAKAYSRLERDGIIYSVPGKGSFVAKQKGMAELSLTRDFEQAARAALGAGVSVGSLMRILNRISQEEKE